MPDLYDGWEDDVRTVSTWLTRHSRWTETGGAATRLRAAFAPHVHDWRYFAIYANGSEANLVCVGCSKIVYTKGLSTAPTDLPKYDGPDPLEKS